MSQAYEAYLRSEHWLTIRRLALERDDYRCVLCNSEGSHDNPLEVHHRCYHLYDEHLCDVVTLCHKHHDAYHAQEGTTCEQG